MSLPRTPEPELMDSPAQARAYAEADFAEPHDYFVDLCAQHLTPCAQGGPVHVLDLGCGPGDITVRFARRFACCHIHGVDAGPNMLTLGRDHIRDQGLADRIELFQQYLPCEHFPRHYYDIIISNSLLHHLTDPMTLWHSLGQAAGPGTGVLIMDLFRPESEQQAMAMMEEYTRGEPEILRQDFLHSLHAAWRPDEVREQLTAAGLDRKLRIDTVSDRHMIITGRL